jgi:DHA2 family multidrug resistance protein
MNRAFRPRGWPTAIVPIDTPQAAIAPAEIAQGELSGAVGTEYTQSRSSRFFVTLGLMIATAMQAADALIANVALPQLERDFSGGIELGAWIMTSYLCATAVFAPLTALLRRRYGARYLFLLAVGGFIASSLLCALATSAAWLIAFRVFQGAAGGITLPLSQAILLDIYPKDRHGKMLAVWGAALMIGPILGPLLGGLITDLASWRWVFVINLPLGSIAIASLWGFRPSRETIERAPIDAATFVLLIIAVAGLELCLERGVGRSWLRSPELMIETAVTVAACAALVVRARRVTFTIFSPGVFKDLNFSVAAIYNFLTSGMLFVAIVFLPQLGEGALGYTATLAGFTIVPRAVFMTLMILVVGQLIGKVDHRILLASGWVLMAAGLSLLSAVNLENAFTMMIVGSTVQAVGAGLLFTPLSTLAFSTLAPEMRTDAAGIYSLLRQLGFASGVALMTAVFRLRLDANLLALTAPAGGAGTSAPAHIVDLATLRAYAQCFNMMAVAAMLVSPGILLFRRGRAPEAVTR